MTSTPGPRRGILVDANLLVLLVVGLADRTQVPISRRTRGYSPADFDRLVQLLAQHRPVVVTPHVLTEVSNLTGQLPEPLRSKAWQRLAALALTATEHPIPSAEIVGVRLFRRLGLTDAAISMIADRVAAVVTDDAALWDALARANPRGVEVINFTHGCFAE